MLEGHESTYLHVELCTRVGPGIVKSEELNTHEIFARGDASGHGEVVPSTVRDHRVHGPLAVRKTVMCYLEPLQAGGARVCGTVNLCEPVADWSCSVLVVLLADVLIYHLHTLVTLRDRVVWIVRALRAANNMAPPSSNLCASRNRNDSLVEMGQALVASERPIVDILDGIVAVGSSYALQLALIDTVDGDLLENRMRGD